MSCKNYGCTGLTSITIPNSVTSINFGAFIACANLATIKVEDGNAKYDSRSNCNAIIESASNNLISGCKNTVIPNSVTSIGEFAFTACSGLTSITIPNSVTSIGRYAFHGCPDLTSITIPNGVTSIGEYTFTYCSKLTSITIPNSVTSIGRNAFEDCYSLTSITIPNSVTSIGSYAFYGCSGLTSIKVEEGNTKYDSRSNCNAIIETESSNLIVGCNNTIIPNSVSCIGSYAFYNCSGLTSIIIPNSVTSIGIKAFYGCSGLTSIKVEEGNTKYDSRSNCNAIIETESSKLIVGCNNTIIPNSVTYIGGNAFYHCHGLTSVIIPNSVTTIGEYAFLDCPLNEVYNEATTPQKFAGGDPRFRYRATLHVPAGTKALYQTTSYWKYFSNTVEDINTVVVEDDKDPATTVEGENFYNLVLDKETVKYADIISVNEAGMGCITIKDGGLLIIKGDDVRFALSEIKKSDILVFDFVGKIRCLYGTLTANSEQQNSFPQVTSDEMELESGKEYIANDDCDVVLEMETTESPVELKSITITEPTGVNIVETSTSNPSSCKTYNLAGQQVNADSNGLLIHDGKKVIK